MIVVNIGAMVVVLFAYGIVVYCAGYALGKQTGSFDGHRKGYKEGYEKGYQSGHDAKIARFR